MSKEKVLQRNVIKFLRNWVCSASTSVFFYSPLQTESFKEEIEIFITCIDEYLVFKVSFVKMKN